MSDDKLNRIDYLLLLSFESKQAKSSLSSATLSELEIHEYTRNCLNRHLKNLLQLGLVCYAGNANKERMYYISSLGLERVGVYE